MNVLIADDNKGCIELLLQILETIPDTRTTAAFDGCEAWWHLSDPAQSFDLLIADVNMPAVNGLSLTRRVRSSPSLKELNIILCSGLNDRKTIENIQSLGVLHYVVKPYSLSTMVKKIHLTMPKSS